MINTDLWAVDRSQAIIFDVPDEIADKQFGPAQPPEIPPEMLEKMAKDYFDGNNLRVIAFLVGWSNRPGTYPVEVFEEMFFSRDTYPGGSIADYFYEVSYGQVEVTGDIIDWIPAGYYYPDYNFGPLIGMMDLEVDYSQYDGNNDGNVDMIVFIRSGTGMEDTGDPNDIWSYALTYYPGNELGPFDGKMVPKWNTSPELRPLRNPDNPTQFLGENTLNRIRVFCHEMSHGLGLPDLYDYDEKLITTTYYTPDDDNDHPMMDWCLMGYAGYGLFSIRSEKPSHLSGWCKKQMGWNDPVILDQTIYSNLEIYSIETSQFNSLYLYPIDMESDEYFLLEYRNPKSTAIFDKTDSDFSVYFWPDLTFGCDTLDQGLLITHVHEYHDVTGYRMNDGWPDDPHYVVCAEDMGYNPAYNETYNPLGHVTDTAQWWYPYETRKGALLSPDIPHQTMFSPETYPSSDGYYIETGLYVEVTEMDNDKLTVDLYTVRCGDLNDDREYNLLDIVYYIDWKFKEKDLPVVMGSADVNNDDAWDVLDIVHLIDDKFKEGADPVCW
jgi:M6 family metalloprotease-like protein